MRIALLAMLAFPAAVSAQSADIVVTLRGLAALPGDAALGVVDLSSDRIAATASNRLEDALRDVAGLQQFRRSDARSANPTSQGVTLRGLGGNAAARALVLLDGVPQGDPFGGFISWPLYVTDRIGSVRVTRGGGSGVAGPGALAGTIEIDSRGARDAPAFIAGISGGSRVSLDASTVASAHLGAGFGLIAASYARSDGFVPTIASQRGSADKRAPYDQFSIAARGIAPLGGSTELQANIALFDDQRTRGTDFTMNSTTGADASLRIIGTGALPFALLGYVQLRRFASQFASLDAARAVVTPTLDQYDTPSTGIGGRIEVRPRLSDAITLRLGADGRHVSGQTEETFTYVAGSATRLREAGGVGDTFGAFADASIGLGRLTLTGGARIDHWRMASGRLIERTIGSGALITDLHFAARNGWEPTGRIGAAWRMSDAVTLRGAAYLGWRLPTLNELYRPFRLGADATAANAALDPETSHGAEFGIELAPLRGARLAMTVYAVRLTGAIANVTLANGPGTFPGVGFVSAAGAYRQRLNLDAIDSRGIEVEAAFARGAWRWSGSLAYTDARVHSLGLARSLDGLRPAQTAPFQAATTIGWHMLSGTLRYSAAQFEDDQNRRRLRPALTVDVVAAVPVSDALTLSIRGENLFDSSVEAGISAAGIIERAGPRTLWVGLRVQL